MSEPQQDTSPPPSDGVRLELKPGLPRTGYVDGGWWPRSRDLRAELPGLVAALATRIGGRIGPVQRVGFGRPQWDPIGRERLLTTTGQVAFDGFGTFTPDVVWIVGRFTDRAPIILLVVPPETPEAEATATLRRAGTATNTDRPDALLATTDDTLVGA